MFVYCTEVLHLSEAEAYFRIAAARAARKYPMLLVMLGECRLHLSGIAILAPHLTEENRERVLARAAYKSKRQIEELVAGLAPKPDVPAVMRKLPPPPATLAVELCPDRVETSSPPDPEPPAQTVKPAPPAPTVSVRTEPLSPERYRVQFTASRSPPNRAGEGVLQQRGSLVAAESPALQHSAVTSDA